jgi:CheY-like chemotaxis protein
MTVLVLGRHLELGLYRAEFLQDNGYGVIFPKSKAQALSAIRQGGFDVVVLSYSLSNDTARELVDLLEQYYPRCPVIALSDQRWDDRKIQPDHTVLASDGPEGLLFALEQIQHKRLHRAK